MPVADSLAVRGAHALFLLAQERNALETTLQDAERIAECYALSADLRRCASNPTLPVHSVEAALGKLARRLKVGELITNTLRMLARKRRLQDFPALCRALHEEARQMRGEIRIEVQSARALSPQQQRQVEKKLQESQRQSDRGKKAPLRVLDLQFVENKGLLGGALLKVQSRTIDMSLKTELRRLKRAVQSLSFPKTPAIA